MRASCVSLLLATTLGASAQEVALSRIGDHWQFFPAITEPPGGASAWQLPGYDDSFWLTGRSGFSSGYAASEATRLPDLGAPYQATYFRRSFNLEDAALVRWLVLRVDYSDGFVAYLNGQEIARRNLEGAAGAPVPFDRVASAYHFRSNPEEIIVTEFTNALRSGTNLLSVQLHGAGFGNAGLCFSAELVANFTRAPHVQNTSSNRVQIAWKTPVPSDSWVRFGTTPDLVMALTNSAPVTTHVLTLTNLTPDTLYYYQVGSSGGGETVVSAPASFRTFKVAGPVRFTVFGDAGWNSIPQYNIARVMRESEPDLLLEVGDTCYPSFTPALADPRIFSVYQEHMRGTPYFFILGNHDLLSGVGHYLEAFHLPTNSVALEEHAAAFTSPEHYYSFDHGDVHFTALFVPFLSQYAPKIGDAQYRWLTNDLASTQKPWKIVLWHVPMHTSSLHRLDDMNFNGIADSIDIQDVLLPVLREHGVQLVFAGHEHGYERFNPIGGVHSLTSGGGGYPLYAYSLSTVSSAFFWSRHNCVSVRIEGDTLEAEALGEAGEVFDRLVIQKAVPNVAVHQAAWHSPFVESEGDQRQSFDFRGEPLRAVAGSFSNLGRVWVNNDRNYVYLGFEQPMIYDDNNLFLFIETPRLSGVPDLRSVGNGIPDAEGQGADGLDFLSNLSFNRFNPGIGLILGDVKANRQLRSFSRTNFVLNIGQGAFKLDASLSDVPGVRLRQFHLASLGLGAYGRDNAQFIKVAIPYSELGGIKPGELIQIGAVVGLAGFDAPLQTRVLDSGYLGTGLQSEDTHSVLQGIRVQLANDPNPDLDGDGLGHAEELALGTDPASPDTDRDGLPDGWEAVHQLNPLSDAGDDGAAGDPDHDNASNLSEFVAGTLPKNFDSSLRLQVELEGLNKLRIHWNAALKRTYRLQVSQNSLTGFHDVPGPANQPNTTWPRMSQELEIPALGPPTFYRVRVVE